MLKTLKNLFESFTSAPADTSPEALHHQVQLAAAVLLVEVMRTDPTLAPAERDAVVNALRARFSLRDDEMDRLLELAHESARTAYDYQRFTSLLNEHFTQPQKVAMVEAMWEVAYADAHLHENENHVISKVAGLLHVTHGEYIAAKLHAKAASPAAS